MNLTTASTEDLLARRDRIVDAAMERFERGDAIGGIGVLRDLETATIDADTLERTDPLLEQIASGRTIVASFDPARTPGAGEVVLVYGNYPHDYNNVVVNNPVKRHVADFWRFKHDRVESDPRWSGVDRIFVINAARRVDRYDSVLRELALARAPFDRVSRHEATIADWFRWDRAAGQLACLKSHIAVLKSARESQFRHTLVLEDDFCFTSDIDAHLADLQRFVERDYPYWVCLVATSKYGPIVAVDDLIARSYQRCTNTAGYLVSADGVEAVLRVFEDAVAQIERGGDLDVYSADRCWSILQPSGRFLAFRRKFGFQSSSFSDIEQSISRYLD